MRRLLLLAFGVILLMPLYLTAIGSFQNILGVWARPPRLWPHRATLDNYAKIGEYPIAAWALTTAALAIIVIIGTAIVCLTAGYSLALRPRRWLFWSYMSTMMLPGAAMLIPHFVVIRYLGLLRTIFAAGLPLLWFPLGIFFAREYIRSIPASFAEAARMDGASELAILREVMLPLSLPVVGVIALVKAVQVQQDYIWQVIVRVQTLAVGLIWATTSGNPGQMPNPLGAQMAAGMLLVAPLLLLFLVAGRTMMRGMPVGGLRE